ncbi:MAG: Crp/Fnr family transcriptional regulator [Actinomycetota bacterium]
MNWPLLAGVPEADIRRVLATARRRSFGSKEVVFHAGDPADTLHLIKNGRFAVQATTQLGDTATFAVLGPGESFGEVALVSEDAVRSATVVALEPSETYSIYHLDFVRLRERHPSVNIVLLTLLAGQVQRLSERLVEALYLAADTRVLRRVRDLSVLYGDGSGQAVIPLTQESIAELAGTSRATVNRVLREEEERGTLELGRGKTVVFDPEALSSRAR